MKKNAIRFSVALATLVGVVSCGSNMTPEEIQAEAEKRFNDKKTELAEEASQACNDNLATYQQQMLESLKNGETPVIGGGEEG